MRKLLFLALVAATPLSAFSAVLFQQAETSADGYFSDGISSNGSQFYSQSIADDFSLAATSNVTTIKFWGSSENFSTPDLSNVAAFDIVFYDTSFNPVAQGIQIPVGAFTTTATGNVNSLGGNEYEMDLATNFNLNAGSYYMHVGADLIDPFGDAFVWSNANGNTNIAANFMQGGGWQTFQQEPGTAFELDGQAVPEPASMAILGLGVVAMVRRRRASK